MTNQPLSGKQSKQFLFRYSELHLLSLDQTILFASAPERWPFLGPTRLFRGRSVNSYVETLIFRLTTFEHRFADTHPVRNRNRCPSGDHTCDWQSVYRSLVL